MSDTPRKFATGRYTKQPVFCLDHDGSKYVNRFEVVDGEKSTGILISESGDSNVEGSNKITIDFNGTEYPLLRDAIFAYEDEAEARGPAGSYLRAGG